MNELREAVFNTVNVYRKYYKDGDIDFLPAVSQRMEKLREINESVWYLLDNCNFFYVSEDIEYDEIYHVIDYLCKTELEMK